MDTWHLVGISEGSVMCVTALKHAELCLCARRHAQPWRAFTLEEEREACCAQLLRASASAFELLRPHRYVRGIPTRALIP